MKQEITVELVGGEFDNHVKYLSENPRVIYIAKGTNPVLVWAGQPFHYAGKDASRYVATGEVKNERHIYKHTPA
jgi:hypothetical protein